MQLPPFSVISAYPKANFVDPERRGPGMIIACSILYPLVLIVVGLRTYTRIALSKSFGWDDGFIIAAVVPATGFMICAFLAVGIYGSDRHVWDVPLPTVVEGLKMAMATQCLFCLASALNKISMLLLTCRIMTEGTSVVRILAKLAIALVAVNGMIYIVIVIFQCRPISAYWTLSFLPQQCVNERLHVLIAGCINTITDFISVLLPIPVILKLQLPRRQMTIIALLFAAGFAVCVAGTIRTVYTYFMLNSNDQTWNTYPVWLSSAVELYVGIIGASIPVTKQFFRRHGGHFSSSAALSASKSTNSKSGSESAKTSSTKSQYTSTVRSAEEGSAIDLKVVPSCDVPLHTTASTSRPDCKDSQLWDYGSQATPEPVHDSQNSTYKALRLVPTSRYELPFQKRSIIEANPRPGSLDDPTTDGVGVRGDHESQDGLVIRVEKETIWAESFYHSR